MYIQKSARGRHQKYISLKRHDHTITISFVSFIIDAETEEMKGMVMLYGKAGENYVLSINTAGLQEGLCLVQKR